MSSEFRSIRVVIQQPALPKYRVPVFRELARRPGLAVQVVHGSVPGLTNVAPSDLATRLVRLHRRTILGQTFLWHAPQWEYATRAGADVLILSWNTRYASLVPALLRARSNRVPTVLWGHGYSKHEAAWRSWPRRKIAELATALLFYNHTTARKFVEHYSWDPGRVFVALNALDQAPIQAARQHWLKHPEQLDDFRQSKGVAPGPVLLFVSRLAVDNRVDLLIRATQALSAAHPGVRAVIIGKGPDEDRLREVARDLDVSDRVRFVGAVYDEMQLAPWFLSSAAFCYPANIGLSMLHAFGYGLPVVTSDRVESQNPEIDALRPGQNGMLYAHDSVESLCGSLTTILNDPQRAATMSAEALRTATQQFTLANMVDGMEAAARFAAAGR